MTSGSFLPEEATEVDAPASGFSTIVMVVVVVVVVVVGIVVVVDTIDEVSESWALLLHVTAVTHIEATPRQIANSLDRWRRKYERLIARRCVKSVAL